MKKPNYVQIMTVKEDTALYWACEDKNGGCCNAQLQSLTEDENKEYNIRCHYLGFRNQIKHWNDLCSLTENCPSRIKLDMACKTLNNGCASSRTPDASLLLHSCIMLQAISLSSVYFCVYLLAAPSGQIHLHLGCISDRKCLYCPLAHIQEYTYAPDRAKSEIWPSLWAAASGGSSPRANEGGSKSTLPFLPSSSHPVSIPLAAVHKQ